MIFSSIVEVFRSGAWQHALVNPTDAFSPTQPAFVLSYTPTARFCPYNVPMQSYRVVNNSRSIWDNGTANNHTTISQTFSWNMLTNDPRCVAPAGPTTSSTTSSTTTSTTAVPRADLDLTVSHSPPSPFHNEPFSLVFTASNTGSAPAEGAQFVVDLPDSFNGVVASVPSGTCTVDAENVVRCSLGTLFPTEENLISIQVAGGAIGTFAISGTLSSTTTGVASSTTTDSIVIRPSADLKVTKSAAETTVAGVYDFQFDVDNNGPDATTNVVLTDSWPGHLEDPTIVPTGCVFDDAADTLTCTRASMASGSGWTWVVRAAATAGTNTATVRSDVGDPDTSDNTDSAVIA